MQARDRAAGILMTMRDVMRWLLPAMCVFAVLTAQALCQSTGQPRKSADQRRSQDVSQLGEIIRPSIEIALAHAENDGDFKAAEDSLARLFDQVIANGDVNDKLLFRDTAFALRLIRLMQHAEQPAARDLLAYLRANPDLARALAFLINVDETMKPAEILAVLERLRARHGDSLNDFANLAAAICVVHRKPLAWQINENRPEAVDPVLLFEYFAANESKMLFGVRTLPAELLVYVVDCPASIEEMQWALQRYAGDREVGARFFDIAYDHDHFVQGTPKKVNAAGWNLPNILKHGGVCADQAYFAATVGKAIGVPTSYTIGASSELSHAWVGFVRADRSRAWWDFTSGRYEEYQGVRGYAIDPQTRQPISDSYISLLADFVGAKTLDRQAAAALTDAAERLAGFNAAPFEPEPMPELKDVTPRSATTVEALRLLESGLTACPGYADGWRLVQKLAEQNRLSLDDKKRWGGVLHRLCGERYPDFYLAIITPMIQTIDDVREQNALWNAAFKVFQNRHDLAAAVRMEQANMWLEQAESEKAGQCCEDVINRYANAGPFVIQALRKAEKILRDGGGTGGADARRILALYQHAWSQIERPRDMAGVFFKQSNWFRVGKMYAERLDDAGARDEAAKVRTSIGLR